MYGDIMGDGLNTKLFPELLGKKVKEKQADTCIVR